MLEILGLLSLFLLIGMIIVEKIEFLKKYCIPSAVVGGILLLVLFEINEKYWNITSIIEMKKTISQLPGILIFPIIASIPLGMKKLKFDTSSIKTTFILIFITILQLTVGIVANILFLKKNIYKSFGVELNIGFAGGHSTAGTVGNILKERGVEYWELSQGIATTMATIGLLIGIFLGIVLININKKNISQKQKNIYREKIEILEKNNGKKLSLDNLIFHIATIFSVCGLAKYLTIFFKRYSIPILSLLTPWIVGMLVMSCIWTIIKRLNLEDYIDENLKKKIINVFIEYAVISGVATIPITKILKMSFPILVLVFLGSIFTYFFIFHLCKKLFEDNYYFERGIAIFGTSFGVFFTGILLLRYCNSDVEEVMKDYSLGFSMVALLGPLLILITISLMLTYNLYILLIFYLIVLIISYLIIVKINWR